MEFNAIWKGVMKDMDKIGDLAVQLQSLVASGLVIPVAERGYTYVEQRHDPMMYTDWSLLHEQEIELYKPQ